MFERMKNSKLAYVIVFLTCLNGVVGCYKPRIWDAKYYKYQPTFQDRAVARSMVMDKDVLVDNSFKEIETLIDDKALSDENKKASMKNAMRAMVNEKDKKERKNDIVNKCLGDIRGHIKLDMPISKVKNEDKVRNALEGLVDKAVKHEEKKYTVNGMEFQVKDNCIYFSKLDVSVPLTDIKVSDADVIGFSSDIQKALRWRMDTARRVRLGSGTAQILAASAGATLGFVTKDVTTAAALAAFSAVIPELQNIFQARDRSGAYQQGLELIQDAEARYYQNRTANGTSIETVSTNRLTKEGGELLVQISACLKLVDKALLQTIPTIADLQAATGKLAEALGQIKVVPTNLNLGIEGTQTAHIINSKAIAYAVSDAKVVEVVNFDPEKATEKIEIKGVGPGTATVTVYNALGHAGYFDVTVGKVKIFRTETGSATKVGTNIATLSGSITNDYSFTDVWLEYGTSEKIGSSTTKRYADSRTLVVTEPVTDLLPGTMNYFRVVGSSTAGKILGEVKPFLTYKAITCKAEVISETSAMLTGEVITQDEKMNCWFMYGTETGKCVIKSGDVEKEMAEKKGSLNKVTKQIEGLTQGTVYYYKFFAKNDVIEIQGEEQSFITRGTSVQTNPVTYKDGPNTVTLNGTVTTNCSSIKVWFKYGTKEENYSKTIDVNLGTITESTSRPVKATLSNLAPGKYSCKIAAQDNTSGSEKKFEGSGVDFDMPPTP